MEVKNFELTVPFIEHQSANGDIIYLPLVEVTFITPNSTQTFSLMFDTAATRIYLRYDLYPLLGLSSWDEGDQTLVAGFGGTQVRKSFYLSNSFNRNVSS